MERSNIRLKSGNFTSHGSWLSKEGFDYWITHNVQRRFNIHSEIKVKFKYHLIRECIQGIVAIAIENDRLPSIR